MGRRSVTPKISAIASYGRSGASARVRLFDWLDYIGINAREEVYIGGSNNSIKSLLSRPVDVLTAEMRVRRIPRNIKNGTAVISRRATPFSNGYLEEKILLSAERGVYDYDDSLATTGHSGVQRLWSTAKTWQRSVTAADVVIAGNEHLAEQASSYSKNVKIIPSCVNPNQYKVKTNYSLESPKAIWIGSPSTEPYLHLISEALLKLNASIGLRLTVVSSGAASLGALDNMIDRINWSPENYKSLLAESDIGIMPLPNNEWALGKCAYKLLQYGAVGLPMIGTPVGANARVLGRSRNLAADTPDEWFDLLSDFFAGGDSHRYQLGLNSRNLILNEYSFQAWEKQWTQAMGINI